jgi:hypothetical protein
MVWLLGSLRALTRGLNGRSSVPGSVASMQGGMSLSLPTLSYAGCRCIVFGLLYGYSRNGAIHRTDCEGCPVGYGMFASLILLSAPDKANIQFTRTLITDAEGSLHSRVIKCLKENRASAGFNIGRMAF